MAKKNTTQTTPLTTAQVPDEQAIPGIRGPKTYEDVTRALKLKVMGNESLTGTLALTVTLENGKTRKHTYEVPVRLLTTPEGHTFAHVPTYAEIRNSEGTSISEGDDNGAVELYQEFKELPGGRGPAPTIALPDSLKDMLEQVRTQIYSALTDSQKRDVDSGKAELKQVDGFQFRLVYKRNRKAKKEETAA